MEITPHIDQNQSGRGSGVDQRTTRHLGYEVSQRKRKRIEEVFEWLKTVGMLRQLLRPTPPVLCRRIMVFGG